ncbi:metal-dependent hydrolase [Neogemmobacter tilapiae]|uniref:Metal-dependent hydrolase n=1 Tax=Neogemmobacter tilapiae TaxID=875041 RepID=A0A918TEZ7_9RHOB|nr:metal-dependent hydrolase [Gemmobacter tilapiae]GHC45751.1 metal-dependent hydrolase [Gemmobacter tilapiae]
MILAHLPAGYLTGRAMGARRGLVLWAALLGGVFPDFDMFWFHLVDQGSVHHHRYPVHIPGFWALVALIALPLIRLMRPALFAPACAFLAAIAVHLVLDSVGGGILWLWPFNDQLYSLIKVPATQSHWVLSFIFHWSFLAEIAIVGSAVWVWLKT